MSTSAKALGIDRLSIAERLRLVEEKDEPDRGLAALEDDPHAGSSRDDVKARLRRKDEDAS